MDPARFLERLRGSFEDLPASEHPRDTAFADVVERIDGLARPNNLALLNAAVALLPAGEIYVEVGTYQGTSLVGALLGNDAHAVAIDSFGFRDGSRESLERTIGEYGLDDRVTILEGDAFDLLEARALEEARVGVYYWDAAHDREAVTAGLSAIEPWLVPGALLVVDDSDWERVEQGIDDYLGAQPRAHHLLTIDGSRRGAPHWWEGMQVLAWDG